MTSLAHEEVNLKKMMNFRAKTWTCYAAINYTTVGVMTIEFNPINEFRVKLSEAGEGRQLLLYIGCDSLAAVEVYNDNLSRFRGHNSRTFPKRTII